MTIVVSNICTLLRSARSKFATVSPRTMSLQRASTAPVLACNSPIASVCTSASRVACS